MEGDLLNKINDIKALSEENNKMLKSIRRHSRIGSLMRLLYWIVLLGVGISSYYFIEPFIDPLVGAYKGTKSTTTTIGDIPKTLENLKNFLDGSSEVKK